MDEEYIVRTSLFSELVNEGRAEEASQMVADLWEERDFFDHSVDDDLALVLFSEVGDETAVTQLLELGVNPATYGNAPIKMASQNGHNGIIMDLAKDPRVDILEGLDYVTDEQGKNTLKLMVIKRISQEGDEETLKTLLNDESFRIDGIMDVLREDHKRLYSIKMLSELARTFRSERSTITPEIVNNIARHLYDMDGMTLFETMSIIEPIMKKK